VREREREYAREREATAFKRGEYACSVYRSNARHSRGRKARGLARDDSRVVYITRYYTVMTVML